MDAKSDKNQTFGSWLAIVLPILYLSIISLLTLTSAGGKLLATKNPDPYHYVRLQSMYLIVASFAGLFGAFINLSLLKKYVKPIAIIAIILLILVFIPGIGIYRNGSHRWISLVIVDFQVSDFAKIAIIISMAAYLFKVQRNIGELLDGFIKPLLIMGVFCVLIMLEPDYGTTALCGSVALMMMFFAGTKIKHILVTLLMFIPLFCVFIYFNPERLDRVISFIDIESTKSAGGYQVWQGRLAFGSGGIWGLGLGEGRQHLSYLPEAHTDFILSIIAEELGLFCTMGVAVAFFVIFIASIRTLRNAPDMFQFLLGTGALFMIVGQAIFNMFVVMGMAPTKGISLPFVSYGGTNLVTMFFFAGILVNCMRNWNKPTSIKASEL